MTPLDYTQVAVAWVICGVLSQLILIGSWKNISSEPYWEWRCSEHFRIGLHWIGIMCGGGALLGELKDSLWMTGRIRLALPPRSISWVNGKLRQP